MSDDNDDDDDGAFVMANTYLGLTVLAVLVMSILLMRNLRQREVKELVRIKDHEQRLRFTTNEFTSRTQALGRKFSHTGGSRWCRSDGWAWSSNAFMYERKIR